MNLLKLLAGGAAIGIILIAFRDFENDGWLPLALPGTRETDTGDAEPILGYDGMDQETVIDWIRDADLDQATLLRIRSYEMGHRTREPVITAVDELV